MSLIIPKRTSKFTNIFSNPIYDIEEAEKCENSIEYQISNLHPLYLTGVIRRSKMAPVVNMSTNIRSSIVFSCAHFLIIYDYELRTKRFWAGHKNAITSLSSDKFGKWLVSSDTGPDNLIIVWDFENAKPYCKFNPPPTTYMAKVCPYANYVVSISDENNTTTCSLWAVSNERKEAAGNITFDNNIGTIRNISFDLDSSGLFALTTEKRVLFITWTNDILVRSELEMNGPRQFQKDVLGKLTDSIFLQESTQCLTSTYNGFILVWNDEESILGLKVYPKLKTKMILEKWYHLQKNGICVLRQLNKLVVTGDDLGVIRFYDQHLRLLFWTENTNIPSHLVQIEFHIEKRDYYIKRGIMPRSKDQFSDKAVPTDCTKNGNIFMIQDFIVVDCHGCCYFVDFLKSYCYVIYETSNEAITAMDIHPERSIIVLGHKGGRLTMINYANNRLMNSKLLSDLISEEEMITCIKYSNKGEYIAVGMEKGGVIIMDPCLFGIIKNRYDYEASAKVLKICFSPDDLYMSHIDENNYISLYRLIYEKDERKWIFCDSVKSHEGKITDLIFHPSPHNNQRLFSIGYDKLLIEYYVNSREENGIQVIDMVIIEENAFPTSLSWSINSKGEKCLLITNSEFKYKLYHQDKISYCLTAQGPVFDSPISQCHMLDYTEGNEAMVFSTDKYLGVQLLPVDGNPFKASGILAHHEKLETVIISYDGVIFTLGVNDTCVCMWKYNDRPMKTFFEEGGKGLEPYYDMIDGGKTGWFLQQAVKYFFFIQILHQGFLEQEGYNITPFIKLCDLPTVLCGMGFYPSDLQILEIQHEISTNVYNSVKKCVNTVSFEDLIRIYINHRPAMGITSKHLENHFHELSSNRDTIATKEMIQRLAEGDTLDEECISKLMQALLRGNHTMERWEKDIPTPSRDDELPEIFTLSMIEDDLLGLIKSVENN